MRTTNIRFSGLASGLDTESMVKAMVTPYQMKVDSAIQQQKLLELKKEAWRDVNTKINNFYKDTLAPLRLEGTFNEKEVSLSHQGIIEIDSQGSFPDGIHEIKDVKLATSAGVETQSVSKGKAGSTKLVDELGIQEGSVIDVKVNGKSNQITIDKDMTLDQFADKLKQAGLNASYDANAGAFFISSKGTGEGQTIEMSTSGDTLEKLGIVGKGMTTTGEIKGENASLTYNGITVESETNVVNVNGMSIKILSNTPANTTITAVSQTNTDAIVDKISKFVDEYNKLIEELNTKVNAPYNKDYLPLTDEQKQAMTEEDIKLWNQKVESSILRKDPTIQSILSSMRDIIATTTIEDADGKKYSLADFGITTGDYRENGKLHLDKDKLKESINKNPDLVKGLFTNKVQAGNGVLEEEALKQSGIGVRLYADITERLKGNNLKSSSFLFNDKELDKRISDQKDEVSKLEERMIRMENLYYTQFTNMEKMMSQLNNQSSWLAGQLGAM